MERLGSDAARNHKTLQSQLGSSVNAERISNNNRATVEPRSHAFENLELVSEKTLKAIQISKRFGATGAGCGERSRAIRGCQAGLQISPAHVLR